MLLTEGSDNMKRWHFHFDGDKGILYLFSALTAFTMGLFAPVWLTYLILNLGVETKEIDASME
jgi:hypothetical protein